MNIMAFLLIKDPSFIFFDDNDNIIIFTTYIKIKSDGKKHTSGIMNRLMVPHLLLHKHWRWTSAWFL